MKLCPVPFIPEPDQGLHHFLVFIHIPIAK